MPELSLLPLGSVVELKGAKPGWEDLRYMITGYFCVEKGGPRSSDYVITPWPLGYLNYEDGKQEIFYSCDEDGIVNVDFLGAVDESLKSESDFVYREAMKAEDLNCHLAQGAEPLTRAYGDLPATVGNLPFDADEVFPLGTVVSTKRNGDQKVMIYQNQRKYRGERYDYGICAWPQGADPGSPDVILIKQEEITAVHFRGYENELSRELAEIHRRKRRSLFSRLFH